MAKSVIFATLVALLAAVTSLVADIPLPYPASQFKISRAVHPHFPLTARNLSGTWASNTRLHDGAARILQGQVHGCETPIPEPDGSILIADATNTLRHAVRARDGSWQLQKQPVLRLGAGRVLGGKLDAAGDVWLCDAVLGLLQGELSSRPDRPQLVLVASKVSSSSPVDPGSDITYADDLDIAADGTVFFSDATSIAPVRAASGKGWDMLWPIYKSLALGRPTGRLLRYSPATGQVDVLAKGFWFANGVSLASDESFVLVADSIRMAVFKYWLKGPKAGSTDLLVDALPGHPDGISRAPDGNFWLTLYAPPLTLHRHAHHYLMRLLLAWLPKGILPRPKPWGAAVKLTGEGQVLHFLEDPEGKKVSAATAAVEVHGQLLLGNLHQNYLGVYDLKQLTNKQGVIT